jgi:hypothetical protein
MTSLALPMQRSGPSRGGGTPRKYDSVDRNIFLHMQKLDPLRQTTGWEERRKAAKVQLETEEKLGSGGSQREEQERESKKDRGEV